jgi:hypothetical protein
LFWLAGSSFLALLIIYLLFHPKALQKKRATKHGLLMFSVVIIFAAALLLRQKVNVSTLTYRCLELAGVILLSIAGWLGGTLVYRNQIGVDIRYAHAGKWRKSFIHDGNGNMTIETADDLKVNQMKLLHIDGKPYCRLQD